MQMQVPIMCFSKSETKSKQLIFFLGHIMNREQTRTLVAAGALLATPFGGILKFKCGLD